MAQKFVPEAVDICEKSLKKFVSLVGSIEKLVVVTGAGISTESGIQDYRSKDVGLYARITNKPISHQDFMGSKRCRQGYWSRNILSWPEFGHAVPNYNHYSLANWESSGRLLWLITQNVDGLHLKAGSSLLTELHGNAHKVKCMRCDYVESRNAYQSKLEALNPRFKEMHFVFGDKKVEIEKDFNISECPCCGGIMKTDVTFFGDSVSMDDLKYCDKKVEESDGVLFLGTSLAVSTGSRFVYDAQSKKKPIFIVNIGPTQADHLATMKVDYKISDVLKEM